MNLRAAVNALVLLAFHASAFAQAPLTVPATPPKASAAAAPNALQPVSRASIVSYLGSIEVERADTGVREAVTRAPFGLAPGDRVRTGYGGRATVQFRDASQVILGPEAIFTVKAEQPREISIFLAAGKLWAAVSKNAGRRFAVRTATAVAAVRGTEFSVEVLRDRDTAVEVFGGLVSVRGALGVESMVSANQRVDVIGGRNGSVERFSPKPESVPEPLRPLLLPGKGDDKDKRRADNGPREDGERGRREERKPDFGFDTERFKGFIERQARDQMDRDRIESQAAFEQKSQLYQEGKTLIDAFGRRVRIEEHILRPSADSFKFVSFNFRDNRTDFSSVEVTANRPLPEQLGDAGNLWFSPGAPAFWAVKQRLTMSNGVDSVVEVGVDGAPQLFTFSGGQPIFDPNTNTFTSGPSTFFYKTMFGNKYEFINGNPAAIADMYSGAFRPVNNGDVSGAGNTVSGLMWRTQPVKVDVTDGSVSRGVYWTDAFVKYSANDGLAYAQTTFQPSPGAAHFVSQRSYFNFRDTNNNGILDFGEDTDPTNPAVFHDVVARMNGTSLVAVPGAGTRQTAGDTLVFSDRQGTGIPTGNPQATIAYPGTPVQDAMNFAQNNPRAWLAADEFAIDDFGAILPAGTGFNNSASLFSGENFERHLRSSLFSAPDIDTVMSPAFIFQSGVSNASNQDRPVPSPGPKL